MKRIRVYEIVFVVVAILIGGLIKEYYNDEIKHNRSISKAYVTKVWITKRPPLPRIEYYYLVKSDTFFSFHDIDKDIPFSKLKLLENKNLIVAYDSTDPKSKRLLITESDFKKYGISYPDSMLWMKQLLGE